MNQQKSMALSDSDNDDLVPLSQLGSARESNTPKLPQLRTSGKQVWSKDDDASDDDPIISSSRRSQKPAYKLRRPPVIEDDDDEDEDEDIQPTPVKRRSRRAFVDDEEDEAPPTVSPQKRLRPTVESTASSEVEGSPSKRRRRGTQRTVDSDDDDGIPTPCGSSRSRSQASRSSKGRSRDSASTTPSRITRQKKGKKKHRTAREKQLEVLRRKREGDNSELTESESESESDNDDLQSLDVFEDEEEEEAPVRKSAKGKKKSATPSGNVDDLDDFVIDDDEDDIGIPGGGLSGIPLEFTHHAHKKPHEHFKDAVEWMVHNKINPAFARDDPVYQQAFRKLDDECSGLAKSKFASSQWTQEYTRAVYARPLLEHQKMRDGEGIDLESGLPKCFACNHRKHPASAVLCFTGKAYDRKTLEDIDQGSDDSEESKSPGGSNASEDSDDDESKSVNDKGHNIPPVSKRFAVGK
jgi:hypothetical protein